MRYLFLRLRIIKIVFALLIALIKLNIAFKKSREGFRKVLVKEKLPRPLIKELLEEYDSTKRQFFSLLKKRKFKLPTI